MALVLGVLFSIVVMGITVAGAMIMKSHQAKTRTNFVSHGQAMQFARSGLTEAVGWLRKQTAQPVIDFEPVLDTTASPPVLETSDPDIGIVREFKITGAVWGRYEVWKDWATDPDPTRQPWRDTMRSMDISAQRGGLSPGTVWNIRSIGYVFRRVDPSVPFNELPNQVIGQDILEVEARRLSLQPPGQAALCSRRGNQVTVGTKGRVVGGNSGAGIYYPTGTGSPSVSGTGASVTGLPAMSANAGYSDSIESVFGVSLDDLQAMADRVVNDALDFPDPVPIKSLIVCKVPMTFSAAHPLSGTGVIVFLGNVTLQAGSYSAFSGLIYVQGNLSVREPAEIQGAVVVTGTTSLIGSADFTTITYDDGILNSLRQELGSYRLASAVARPLARDR